MKTFQEPPRWARLVKWLVAFGVLLCVVIAACYGHSQTVGMCVLEGVAFGMLFGLFAVGSRAADSRRPMDILTPQRVWVIVWAATKAAAVVGLLCGLTKALVLLVMG